MPKRVAVGVVTSDKMQKTRKVELPRQIRHPKYGKYLRSQTVCFVHDEQEEAGMGDTVEIQECNPRSKKKCWELVRIVAKSTEVDLAKLRAGQADDAEKALPTGG